MLQNQDRRDDDHFLVDVLCTRPVLFCAGVTYFLNWFRANERFALVCALHFSIMCASGSESAYVKLVAYNWPRFDHSHQSLTKTQMQQHNSGGTLPVAYIVSEELVRVSTSWGTRNQGAIPMTLTSLSQNSMFVTDLEHLSRCRLCCLRIETAHYWYTHWSAHSAYSR